MSAELAFNEDRKMIGGEGEEAQVPNGAYPTMSPIIQQHARRLWVLGLAPDDKAIVRELRRIDRRVSESVALGFLRDKTETEEWKKERELLQARQYNKMLEDSQQLSETIDYKYDTVFGRALSILQDRLFVMENEPEIAHRSTTSTEVKRIVATLKELFLCQRLARGLAGNVVRVQQDQKENEKVNTREVIEIRDIIQTDLNKQTSTIRVLDPIQASNS